MKVSRGDGSITPPPGQRPTHATSRDQQGTHVWYPSVLASVWVHCLSYVSLTCRLPARQWLECGAMARGGRVAAAAWSSWQQWQGHRLAPGGGGGHHAGVLVGAPQKRGTTQQHRRSCTRWCPCRWSRQTPGCCSESCRGGGAGCGDGWAGAGRVQGNPGPGWGGAPQRRRTQQQRLGIEHVRRPLEHASAPWLVT